MDYTLLPFIHYPYLHLYVLDVLVEDQAAQLRASWGLHSSLLSCIESDWWMISGWFGGRLGMEEKLGDADERGRDRTARQGLWWMAGGWSGLCPEEVSGTGRYGTLRSERYSRERAMLWLKVSRRLWVCSVHTGRSFMLNHSADASTACSQGTHAMLSAPSNKGATRRGDLAMRSNNTFLVYQSRVSAWAPYFAGYRMLVLHL